MIPTHPDVRAVMAPGPSGGDPSDGGEPTPQMMAEVEAALYRQLYIRPQQEGPGASGPNERREFLHALSSANAGRGAWEGGWSLIEVRGAERVVSRGDVRFWAPSDAVRVLGDGNAPGSPCTVFVGKEMRQLVPGFYMALGDLDSHHVPDREGTKRVLRLYWHLRAEGASRYVEAATSVLNAARLPFRTKVVGDPAGYARADAGVLYILREDFDRAAPLLLDVHGRVKPWLRPTVPMFTKPLRDGLGLAEDPGGGLSFGQSRCRLAAAALWACRRDGIVDADARAAAFGRVARAAGLDPDLPFLEPGSRDAYAI